MPHKKTRLSVVAGVLNSVTENYSAVVPVITLVLAIGFMKFLPPSTTSTLFPNEQAAQKFLQQHRLSLPPRVPVILVGTNCGPCNALTSELRTAGIRFIEHAPAEDADARPLWDLIKNATGNSDLPKVVIGNKIVKPTLAAIKSELPG